MFPKQMGLVAKHATSPILFAIAANSSGPYVVFNGKRLPGRTLTGRHTPPLPPRPRTIFTASMLCMGAVSFCAPNLFSILSTTKCARCG
jgi:hypothetical protein